MNKEDVEIFYNAIGISKEIQVILFENGFDNFESLSYMSCELLEKIGIEDEKIAQSLLENLASIADSYRESNSMKDALKNFEKKVRS